MRINILVAGTALAMSASPALAGGSGGNGGAGLLRGLLAGGTHSSVQKAGGTLSHCLCNTVGSALKGARGIGALAKTPGSATGGIAKMPRSASGVGLIVNSVVGLNGIRGAQGGNHRGLGLAIGLAGTVDGAASLGHVRGGAGLGIGLAGTVTAGGSGLGIARGHGTPIAGVPLANAGSHKSGKIANVSVLNHKGNSGRSAINVAALNRNGGTSGKVVNASVLNRKGTSGRSAVNVAVLNGGGGSSRGKFVDVSVLNRSAGSGHAAVEVAALNGVGLGSGHKGGGGGNAGLLSGFRLINGVPCLPDGTPLTGEAAKAAMMSQPRQPASSSSMGSESKGHPRTGTFTGTPFRPTDH